MKKTNKTYDIFDWIKYTEYYKDLNGITCKKNAFEHWLKYGKKENRIFFLNKEDTNSHEFREEYDFNWKIYIENYQDLKEIKSEKEAWEHCITNCKKEKSVL